MANRKTDNEGTVMPLLKDQKVGAGSKKKYSVPNLTFYGTVRALTATGTGNVTESGQSTNNPQKRPG